MSIDSSGVVATGLMQVHELGPDIDLMAWNTSSPSNTPCCINSTKRFLTEWLELEKAWSPYHLTGDLQYLNSKP